MAYESDSKLNEYLKRSEKFETVNWDDIDSRIKVTLKDFPDDLKQLGNFTTIRRLKRSRFRKTIGSSITHIKRGMTGQEKFRINFPINLKNTEYARFYSLMVSEGSYRTEFSINVPEEEFHEIFFSCIKKLISSDAASQIKIDRNSDVLRSRAPAILRKILPLPGRIPKIILENKELAREYLRIAFEAEGSAILNKKQKKRYLKLSRYQNITQFVTEEKIPVAKRIFLKELDKKYSRLLDQIKTYPPELLEGEQIMLKKHFNIDSKMTLEAIRKNHTGFRRGKVSSRWVLLIYANNIDKFIKEIGFLSEAKISKTEEMKKFRGNNPQYSTLSIIKKISDDEGRFKRKEFIDKMKKSGYKSPSCYLWRFCNKGAIIRVKTGHYKINKIKLKELI